MLVLHAPAGIFGAVDEFSRGLEVTFKPEFLAQTSLTCRRWTLILEWMRATGVGPNHRPEHFFLAAALDEDLLSTVTENVDRKGAVELSFARMCLDKVGSAGLFIVLIDEGDGAGHQKNHSRIRF